MNNRVFSLQTSLVADSQKLSLRRNKSQSLDDTQANFDLWKRQLKLDNIIHKKKDKKRRNSFVND